MLGPQGVVVDTKAGQSSWSLRLQHHVGSTDQRPELHPAGLVVQIQGHPQLGGVVVPPPQAALRPGLIVQEWLEASAVVAVGRLHHDDLGPHAGQQQPGIGRSLSSQLHYSESGQRARKVVARHQITPSVARSVNSASE